MDWFGEVITSSPVSPKLPVSLKLPPSLPLTHPLKHPVPQHCLHWCLSVPQLTLSQRHLGVLIRLGTSSLQLCLGVRIPCLRLHPGLLFHWLSLRQLAPGVISPIPTMAPPTVDSTVGRYPGWSQVPHMAPPAPGSSPAPPSIYSALALWTMPLSHCLPHAHLLNPHPPSSVGLFMAQGRAFPGGGDLIHGFEFML